MSEAASLPDLDLPEFDEIADDGVVRMLGESALQCRRDMTAAHKKLTGMVRTVEGLLNGTLRVGGREHVRVRRLKKALTEWRFERDWLCGAAGVSSIHYLTWASGIAHRHYLDAFSDLLELPFDPEELEERIIWYEVEIAREASQGQAAGTVSGRSPRLQAHSWGTDPRTTRLVDSCGTRADRVLRAQAPRYSRHSSTRATYPYPRAAEVGLPSLHSCFAR